MSVATEELVDTHPARRWRFAPRSLTARLVVGVVALVAVLVLATSAGTYYALQSFLSDRLDQQVQTTARQPVQQLIQDGTFSPSPQTVWITQLSETGTVLDHLPSVGQVQHMVLSNADRARLAAGSLKPSSVTTPDGHQLLSLIHI